MTVTVELFGTVRLRAGTGHLRIEALTVGESLRALARAVPALDGTVIQGDRLHPAFRFCVNATRFVTDPTTPLTDGDALLILAADAGG
jgi:molybdopterin converting factor small subunit